MRNTLRVCSVICMIIGLWLVISLTAEAECGYETNKFDLKAGVEGGGWTAAWAEDISETDVAQGVVAVGVSIYAANPAPFYAWVEELIRRTIQSLSSSIQDRFSQRVIEQANQLAAEAIKAAVQGQSANEVVRQLDTVDFKAGAIQYAGRNYCKGFNQDVTLSNTWGIKPYVAFRWRGSGGGDIVLSERGDSRDTAGVVINSMSGMYLDINSWEPKQGEPVVLNSADRPTRSMEWIIQGNYIINKMSGMYLDINSWNPWQGEPVVLNRSDTPTRSMEWIIQGNYIINRMSGMYLDINSWNPKQGEPVVLNRAPQPTRSMEWNIR